MHSLLLAIFILLGVGQCGDMPAAQITEKILRDSARALDEEIKKLDLSKDCPQLAKLLKLDPALVKTNLVQKKISYSSLACAKLVADKIGQKVQTVLDDNTRSDWPPTLKNAGLTLVEAQTYLDNLYGEVVLLRMEHKTHRKK
jgi:hypothetical protein